MTREQLEGAIAALEAIRPFIRPSQDNAKAALSNLVNIYRAQLAALPPSPWTERERRLRDDMIEIRDAVIALHGRGSFGINDEWALSMRGMIVDDVIGAALAEPPPTSPDLRAALVEAREALVAYKCRCGKAIDNTCPLCNETLLPVRNTGCLNSDQFDSVKAGDWYCGACPDATIRNGKKHWHDRDLKVLIYQTCGRCAAIARIEAVLGVGQ